jgi:ADP-ribose pyrophosphatase YjhB (NUDIX family)
MSGHMPWAMNRPIRRIAAGDGEEILHQPNGEDWTVSWYTPPMSPDGTPHGATGLCLTGDGKIVLISEDGERWDLPGGRPEGNETLEETLRREILEEACATVTEARLLGFCRGTFVAGSQAGRVIVRSLWRAEVELGPWKPRFETVHRRLVVAADLLDHLSTTDGLARIVTRALVEAALIKRPDVTTPS